MSDWDKAKQMLLSGKYTCVICKDNVVYTSFERGIKPLVALLESGESYKAFSAADKVVGRATAFLYVLLGIKAVYAGVISRVALDVLAEQGVCVEYDRLVDNIVNRQGNGICPFEQAVLKARAPDAAYSLIKQKMKEMSIAL